MKPAREQPGVQRDMLRLRETKGDMLCLYAPGSPTRRSYRAVLEVSPINLSLKAEDEQEAIIERFGALIRSLSFPVQILVRNQRLDLSPYIRHLLAQPGADGQHPSTWYALAASLAELLQKIAAQRTLIERHVYVIIPASQGAGSSRRRSGFPTLVRQAPGAAHRRDRGTGAAGTGTTRRGTHPATGVLRPYLPSPAQHQSWHGSFTAA